MEFDNFNFIKTQGIKVNYLYVCERKVWLFDKGIQLEHTSDKVLMGKILSESAYPDEEKREIIIDNLIKIDIVNEEEIREVKSSNKIPQANKMQLLYYLYYLKKLGIEKKGILNYPKLKRKEEVVLTPDIEKEIEKALIRIKEITSLEKPPKLEKKPFCSKCAYFEFCFG